jgi:hydroxyacid-oxoacid transhydrogenase
MTDALLREETIFTWGAPPLKFGAGSTDEIGFDLSGYGVRRVLIVTDPGVNALGAPSRIADSLRRYDIEAEIFDGVHVEPTDDSMNKAVEYARAQGDWDGFVAVGGGSAIDTAKAINLLTSHPGELMDYINKPIGGAKTPPGQLKPLIAVPTTAGTGSESTAMCVLDIRPAWTSSATRWSPTPPAGSRASTARSPRSGSPTAGRTRCRTCGARRR